MSPYSCYTQVSPTPWQWKLITLVLPPWLLFYRRSTISASRSTISRDTTAALVDSPQKNAKTSLTRMAVSVAAKSMPDISLPIAPRTRPLLADLSITYHLLTREEWRQEVRFIILQVSVFCRCTSRDVTVFLLQYSLVGLWMRGGCSPEWTS